MANIDARDTLDPAAVLEPKLLKFTAFVKSLPAIPWVPWVELKSIQAEPLLPWKIPVDVFNRISPERPILE